MSFDWDFQSAENVTGQVTVSLPRSAGLPSGWLEWCAANWQLRDVQASCSLECSCSAGHCWGEAGICWDATGSLQCGKEELMLGYHCCSTWKAPWHNTHIAREAPFLFSLSLPFFQTLWSEGEPLVWIVEIVESVAFLGDEKKAYFFVLLCLNLFYAFHCLTVLFLSSTR